MPLPRHSSCRRLLPTSPSGAIAHSAHLALTFLDPLLSVLSADLCLSSLLVTLRLAILLHFLDKSYRANAASMVRLGVPLESAKCVLVYAFKVIPFVSKTFELLAMAVIIPVVLLCVVDFAVWCLVLVVRLITKWLAPPRALQSASASSASRAAPSAKSQDVTL
ncbi:hypothetical protein JCM24511_04258 [Saitozyma sp. JCM 24511]|nr:hypothetical protein JCM24511_04258 [Saitozyma sp. JCM 24511]